MFSKLTLRCTGPSLMRGREEATGAGGTVGRLSENGSDGAGTEENELAPLRLLAGRPFPAAGVVDESGRAACGADPHSFFSIGRSITSNIRAAAALAFSITLLTLLSRRSESPMLARQAITMMKRSNVSVGGAMSIM